MPTDDLKFEIQEKPSWRNGGKTTNNLFKDILIWKQNFDQLPLEDRASFQDPLTLCMNIEYVYHSNLAERVGVQTYEGTKDVLERILGLMGGRPGGERNKEEKETVNIAKAYIALRSIHQDMGNTGKLTVEKICAIHRELLNEIRTDAGSLRTIDAYNRLPNNSFNFYAKADVAQAKLHSIVLHHNIHMDAYTQLSKEWSQNDKFVFLIKCAAWLLFNFVEVHPFSDGNGRMGWLLANYVLSLINPFPVHLYEFHDISKRDRQEHFIEAISICRKNPKDGPRDLAALLVEGIWSGWSKCTKALELRQSASSTVTVVIQKSKLDELVTRVKDVGIARMLGISEDEAVKLVREMVERVNVSGFQPQQYSQIKVEGSTLPGIFVRVFP